MIRKSEQVIKNIFREEITFPDERMLLQLTESLAEPHCSSAKSVSKNAFFDESIIFYFLGLIIKKEDESIGKTMESRNTAIISGYCANHYSCILAPVSTACLRIFGDSFSRTIIHVRVR